MSEETPLKVALLTALGSDGAEGAEVSGGSYARQTITFLAATGTTTTSNSAQVQWANMPACTVVGFSIWDSSATPRRLWQIPRTGGEVTCTAGDTVTAAAGSIVLSAD